VNGEIQLVVNTVAGGTAHRDGQLIRRGSLEHRIPYVATIPGAFAVAEAIAASSLTLQPLQAWIASQGLPNAAKVR